MNKVFKHDCSVTLQKLGTFVECECKAVKTSAKSSVLKALHKGFIADKVHCLSPFLNCGKFGRKNEGISVEIIKKRLGLIVNLIDKFVRIGNHCAAADKLCL